MKSSTTLENISATFAVRLRFSNGDTKKTHTHNKRRSSFWTFGSVGRRPRLTTFVLKTHDANLDLYTPSPKVRIFTSPYRESRDFPVSPWACGWRLRGKPCRTMVPVCVNWANCKIAVVQCVFRFRWVVWLDLHMEVLCVAWIGGFWSVAVWIWCWNDFMVFMCLFRCVNNVVRWTRLVRACTVW